MLPRLAVRSVDEGLGIYRYQRATGPAVLDRKVLNGGKSEVKGQDLSDIPRMQRFFTLTGTRDRKKIV